MDYLELVEEPVHEEPRIIGPHGTNAKSWLHPPEQLAPDAGVCFGIMVDIIVIMYLYRTL